MPQFGHKHWQTHFGKTFDVYTRVNVIVFRKSMPVIFVSLLWLAFLASCELIAEILNLAFLFFSVVEISAEVQVHYVCNKRCVKSNKSDLFPISIDLSQKLMGHV